MLGRSTLQNAATVIVQYTLFDYLRTHLLSMQERCYSVNIQVRGLYANAFKCIFRIVSFQKKVEMNQSARKKSWILECSKKNEQPVFAHA